MDSTQRGSGRTTLEDYEEQIRPYGGLMGMFDGTYRSAEERGRIDPGTTMHTFTPLPQLIDALTPEERSLKALRAFVQQDHYDEHEMIDDFGPSEPDEINADVRTARTMQLQELERREALRRKTYPNLSYFDGSVVQRQLKDAENALATSESERPAKRQRTDHLGRGIVQYD